MKRKNEDILALFVLYAVLGASFLMAISIYDISSLQSFIGMVCVLVSLYAFVRYSMKTKQDLAARSKFGRLVCLIAMALYFVGMSLIFFILARFRIAGSDLSQYDSLAVFSSALVLASFVVLTSEPLIRMIYEKRDGA